MEKDIWFGGYLLDEDDKKEIAKMVWEDDKNDIIDYADKVYAEQGDDEPIDRNITFEEIWASIDHDIFREADEGNWKYFEEQYISDWKRKNHVEV